MKLENVPKRLLGPSEMVLLLQKCLPFREEKVQEPKTYLA